MFCFEEEKEKSRGKPAWGLRRNPLVGSVGGAERFGGKGNSVKQTSKNLGTKKINGEEKNLGLAVQSGGGII